MTATPTPLRELPAKWRSEAREPAFPDENDRDAVEAHDAALEACADELEAALSARDAAGAVVCGACGDAWTGQKCWHGHSFPVCYPIATPPASGEAGADGWGPSYQQPWQAQADATPPAASGDRETLELCRLLLAEADRNEACWSDNPTMNPKTRPLHPPRVRQLFIDAEATIRRLAAVAPAGMDGPILARLELVKGGRKGNPTSWVEVPALSVSGCFAVHPEVSGNREMGVTMLVGEDFVVTHLASGLVAAKSPYMETAVKAAKALAELPIDWSSVRQGEVSKVIPADLMAQVNVIRAAASVGGDIITNDDLAPTPPATAGEE